MKEESNFIKSSQLKYALLDTNRIRDSGGDACFLYPSGFERFKRDIENLLDERCEDEEIYTWTAEEYKEP